MENQRKWYYGPLALAAGAIALFGFTGCQEDETPPVPQQTVVEIASESADFNTLVAALEEADLTSALSGAGPFTVFAPNDEAFGSFLIANDLTSEELLSNPALNDILTYHVVSGDRPSAALEPGAISSLEGSTFYVSEDPTGNLWINGSAQVIEADIQASNGVIHVLDGVMVIPSQSIAEIAVEASTASTPEFTQLVAALTKVDLVEAVSGGTSDNLTVFAPTDAAFEALYAELGVSGLDEISEEDLLSILQYHVVPARAFSQDLRQDASLPTLLEGQTLTVDLANLQINESGLIPASINIHGTNGVIHAIDQVLIPGN